MTRSIALLMLLAACGGGVCAGCGGDGVDGPPSMVRINDATWESSSLPGATLVAHCLSDDTMSIAVRDYDTDTPLVGTAGTRSCLPATFDDGFWSVVCPEVNTIDLAFDVRVSADRRVGLLTVATEVCDDTFRSSSVVTE